MPSTRSTNHERGKSAESKGQDRIKRSTKRASQEDKPSDSKPTADTTEPGQHSPEAVKAATSDHSSSQKTPQASEIADANTSDSSQNDGGNPCNPREQGHPVVEDSTAEGSPHSANKSAASPHHEAAEAPPIPMVCDVGRDNDQLAQSLSALHKRAAELDSSYVSAARDFSTGHGVRALQHLGEDWVSITSQVHATAVRRERMLASMAERLTDSATLETTSKQDLLSAFNMTLMELRAITIAYGKIAAALKASIPLQLSAVRVDSARASLLLDAYTLVTELVQITSTPESLQMLSNHQSESVFESELIDMLAKERTEKKVIIKKCTT